MIVSSCVEHKEHFEMFCCAMRSRVLLTIDGLKCANRVAKKGAVAK